MIYQHYVVQSDFRKRGMVHITVTTEDEKLADQIGEYIFKTLIVLNDVKR